MPEQNQIILNPVQETGKDKGSRKEVNLRSCFSASPIYKNDINNEERKEFYQKEILDGTVVNGNGFASVDMNFSDAPNFEDVDTEGLNLPSPHMPNPTSPGPGSLDASKKPAYTGEVPDPAFNIEFGSGLGGLVSPSETASQINQQGVLGSYISGKSYQGSDGTA